MKNKKNRKAIYQYSCQQKQKIKSPHQLLKVKFDVLKNDISCFINKNRNSKYISNKISKNKKCSNRQQSIRKNNEKNEENYIKMKKQWNIRNQSLQLIKQSSNMILCKIQEKGIKFDWNQNEQKVDQNNCLNNFEDTNNQRLWDAFDNNLQKSYASTSDYMNHQPITYYWQLPKSSTYPPLWNQFSIQSKFICDDWRTTLMIKNIPNKYSIGELTQQIDTEHADTYDFLYLPCDLKNQCNVGYGFINFTKTAHLHSFYCKFQQYIWKRYRSQKICSLAYARLQGLTQLIEHFQNSKVLNQKEKKYRPIIKYDEIQKMVLQQQSR